MKLPKPVLNSFFLPCFCIGSLSISSLAIADDEQPQSMPKQTIEAIALDDMLAREQQDYNKRYLEFRRSLRSKYPRGEDRIVALEKWKRDHKEWEKSFEKRRKHLEKIWNWGVAGKPVPPRHVDDLTTAQGRVTAAIQVIRKESKGSGKMAERIKRWMRENKQLLEEAEAERQAPPAPSDNLQMTGSAGERDLYNARKELSRIRRELLSQGGDALKAAMNDPRSEYSQQKQKVHAKLLKTSGEVQSR